MKNLISFVSISILLVAYSCSKEDRISKLNDRIDTCKLKLYFDTTTIKKGKLFFRNFKNDILNKNFYFNSTTIKDVYISNFLIYDKFGTNNSIRNIDICYFYLTSDYHLYFYYDKSITNFCNIYINGNTLDDNIIKFTYNQSWQSDSLDNYTFKYDENTPIKNLLIKGKVYNNVYKVILTQSNGLKSLYFNEDYGILKLDLGEDSLEIKN